MGRVLDDLGVMQEVLHDGMQTPSVVLHSWQGAQLLNVELGSFVRDKYGIEHLTIHRADLRRILFNCAQRQGVDIQMGRNIDKDESKLHRGVISFENAESLHADLIIGADGLHSFCRDALLETSHPPKPTSTIANRILIDFSKLQGNESLRSLVDRQDTHIWLGPNCQALCYPLKETFNFLLYHAATNEEVTARPQPASKDHLKHFFRHWDFRLSELIECAHDFSKWMLFESEPIKTWVHRDSKLVLVGDAAHASSPHL